MTRRAATLSLAGGAVLWGAAAVADSLTYHNDRFDVHGTLPVGFAAGPAPQNGDGREFSSPEDSGHISIYGSYNTTDSITAYREDTKAFYANSGGEITYEAGQDDWFVLSGTEGGMVFYLRVEQGKSCDGDVVLGHWLIEYAEEDRGVYDPRVGKMSEGLNVGSC